MSLGSYETRREEQMPCSELLFTTTERRMLDEPAVGLSPAREKLSGVIRSLAREQNTAILLIEHSVDLVMNVSDRIVVLNGGKKIAEGPPDDIRNDRWVLEAYLG